ncbi:MAG: hypothetical protein ABFS09_05715 [Thermodesulfobacteriota bacterium]
MIDEIDTLGLQMDLAHSHCELIHGRRDTEPHEAVNYPVLAVGSNSSNGAISDQSELVIPSAGNALMVSATRHGPLSTALTAMILNQ